MNVEKLRNQGKNIFFYFFRGKFYEDKKRNGSDEREHRRSRSRSLSKGSLYNKSRSQSKSPDNKEEDKKIEDEKIDINREDDRKNEEEKQIEVNQ